MGACLGSFVTVVAYRLLPNLDRHDRDQYCPRADVIAVWAWLYLSGLCGFAGLPDAAASRFGNFLAELALTLL